MPKPTTEDAQRRNRFSALINQLICDSGKSNISIADAMGYDKQNIISMFKSGKTRLPPDKIEAFARAVGYDPKALLHEWFAAFEPDILPAIENNMGMVLSASERSWIVALRKMFSNRVPPFDRRLTNVIKAEVEELNASHSHA